MLAYRDLLAFCADDIAYWKGRSPDQASMLESLDQHNGEHHTTCCFDMDAGAVRLRGRPSLAYLDRNRAMAYYLMLGTIADKFLPDTRFTIPMDLDDCGVARDDMPLFSFQKVSTDSALLLPDMEFWYFNFYDSMEYHDPVDCASKVGRATFFGSTTGIDAKTGRTIRNTRETVAGDPSERMRAAAYFSGMPDIVFKLPGLVQCDDADAEEYLRSRDYCQGERMPWRQQFDSKYILSLDGNGATCSRVVIALKSNSVLLKYDSSHVLYYFRALVPWVHYVPIRRHEDVEQVVRMGTIDDDRCLSITQNASRVHRRVLSKVSIHKYAAVVINEFYGLFHDDDVYRAARTRIDSLHCLVDITASVQERGDVWCWPEYVGGIPGSGLAIEGFRIASADLTLEDENLEYQCVHQDGSTSAWVPGGYLCGSRGTGTALRGFRMRLAGDLHAKMSLEYRATFGGGAEGGWTTAGDWCVSAGPEALESFELRLSERRAGGGHPACSEGTSPGGA